MPGPPGPQPYSVYGTVHNNMGALASGVTVTATNLTTMETQNATTNAVGEYAFECLNFASQYTNGDQIQCACMYDTDTITIDTNQFGSELLLSGSASGMVTNTPIWSYGESKQTHEDPYWSYGELGHYGEVSAAAGAAIPKPSAASKMIANGLI